MAVLLMGFMDIRLPFVTDSSSHHNTSASIQSNEAGPTVRNEAPVAPKKEKYLHYTSAANRGIFPAKSPANIVESRVEAL